MPKRDVLCARNVISVIAGLKRPIPFYLSFSDFLFMKIGLEISEHLIFINKCNVLHIVRMVYKTNKFSSAVSFGTLI